VTKKTANAIEYPLCVRHLKRRKDVRLRLFFLCDACADQWTTEAFDGNEPLWTGEAVSGYCLLCNSITTVRLRAWFLCDICDRVARSIGRNHVAEQAVLDFWEATVQTRFPHLSIVQNDRSSLRPRRDTDVTGKGPLDFLVTDEQAGRLVFGIENKTGRSSMRDMSQFQLDVSDCDSILNGVRELGVPAFIVHAQVLEQWAPPTMGFRAVSLWWSDIYLMTEHFTSVRMRRDERRGAAYFKKQAFAAIDTFADALYNDAGKLAIEERFHEEGIPPMYVSE